MSVAELRKIAVAQQMLEALKYADEQIGWKGEGMSGDHYHCEHCSAKGQLDWNDIEHEPHCPKHKIRAAIIAAEQEDL